MPRRQWVKESVSANLTTYRAESLYAELLTYPAGFAGPRPSVSVRVWRIDERGHFRDGYGQQYASGHRELETLEGLDVPALLDAVANRPDPS